MRCQSEKTTTTVTVTPCAQVHARVPERGVLRLERRGGAMAGTAALSQDEEGVVLYFADGSEVHLDAS